MASWNGQSEEPAALQPSEKLIVCVTGNWSLLGCWVVKLLLQRRYTVRSTIPFTDDVAAELMSIPEAATSLKITAVDLLDYGSLMAFFHGSIGVFHLPLSNHTINGAPQYPVELVDFEVRKVLNVVEACANSTTVRRLVLTSCMSAVLFDKHYCTGGMVVDERNWSNLDFCKKEKLWSALTKTSVEKAARALATDRELDLVVINPALVVGPKEKNGRSQHIKVNYKALDESGIFAYVHVDDLSTAHLLAFEESRAAGRYLCFERALSTTEIVEAAKQLYPNYPVSQRLESFLPSSLSNKKLSGLGMKFDSRDADEEKRIC